MIDFYFIRLCRALNYGYGFSIIFIYEPGVELVALLCALHSDVSYKPVIFRALFFFSFLSFFA